MADAACGGRAINVVVEHVVVEHVGNEPGKSVTHSERDAKQVAVAFWKR